MVSVYSAGLHHETDEIHLFIGRRQSALKADHDEISLCDNVRYTDVNLISGCVAISIGEMERRLRVTKGNKCKECKILLAEIRANVR